MRLKPFGPIAPWDRRAVADDILRGRAMRVRGYTVLAHVSTGELATAALHNTLLDDVAILKTNIADDGKLAGNIRNHYEDIGTPAISSNVLTIDCGAYDVIDVSFNANITTTTLSNIPASGKSYNLEIYLKADGSARTWAWLTATVVWDGAVAPTFNTTNNHYMRFVVSTKDGGTTWRGLVLSGNYAS